MKAKLKHLSDVADGKIGAQLLDRQALQELVAVCKAAISARKVAQKTVDRNWVAKTQDKSSLALWDALEPFM